MLLKNFVFFILIIVITSIFILFLNFIISLLITYYANRII